METNLNQIEQLKLMCISEQFSDQDVHKFLMGVVITKEDIKEIFDILLQYRFVLYKKLITLMMDRGNINVKID